MWRARMYGMPVTSARKRAAVEHAAIVYSDEVNPANRDLQRLARHRVQAGHGASANTFKGWMPEHPDKFAHTMEENHSIAIYKGHVVWVTGITA